MSQQGPPQEALRKLPVFQTVAEANAMVFRNLPNLAKAAALPYALSLGINFMQQGGTGSLAWSLILILLGLIPETYFAVAWHRFTLLGPKRAAPSLLPPLAPRHWRFLAYAIVMLMISALPIVGGFSVVESFRGLDGQPSPELAAEAAGAMLLVIALLVVAVVLTLRLLFVFPAVAVDESYGLSDSWRHTRGQALRLFSGLLLLVVPWLLVTNIVGAALASGTEGAPGPIAIMAVLVFLYVGMGLGLAFISIAFRECTGWIPAAQAGPPDRVGGENQET